MSWKHGARQGLSEHGWPHQQGHRDLCDAGPDECLQVQEGWQCELWWWPQRRADAELLVFLNF